MRTTKYYIIEIKHIHRVGCDSLIITTEYPGKLTGHVGTSTLASVDIYAHGDFASETAAREFIENHLAETRGGVCECPDNSYPNMIVVRYRTGVSLDTNEGCF